MSRDKTRDPVPGGTGAWCSARHGWVLTMLGGFLTPSQRGQSAAEAENRPLVKVG